MIGTWLGRVALVGAFLWSGTVLAAPEKRVALVVGNAAYRHTAPLKNAANDARLMAQTLGGQGFRMVGGGPLLDADRPGMEKAIRAFGKELREGAIGVFYYSGHGVQVKGTNYMVPVTAQVALESDAKYELVDIGFVLDEMGEAGNRLNIVVLDACRNNPLVAKGLRSTGDGLATMTAPAGTAIAFATQPGNVASDGAGKNSPYTEALARAISTPGLDLFDTFNEVGLSVKKATRGQQQPWLSSSPIEGQFYFAGLGSSRPPSAVDNSHDLARARAEIERLRREADDARAEAEAARAEADRRPAPEPQAEPPEENPWVSALQEISRHAQQQLQQQQMYQQQLNQQQQQYQQQYQYFPSGNPYQPIPIPQRNPYVMPGMP